MITVLLLYLHILLFKPNFCYSFGYTETNGPSTWNGTCRIGRRQSPVNFKLSTVIWDDTLPTIQFTHYDKTSGSLFFENNGITLVAHGFANWGANQPYITGGALKGNYALESMHFHWGQKNSTGSEHTVGGLHYPIELHLVHKKRGHSDGVKLQGDSLAVLAIFIAFDSNGKSLAPLEEAITAVVDNPGRSSKQKVEYSLMDLLPNTLDSFFTYEGSLTTPNCEEVVIWHVLTDPIYATSEMINLIRRTKNAATLQPGINYRPAQPLLGRKVRFRSAARLSKSAAISSLLHQKSTSIINIFVLISIFALLH